MADYYNSIITSYNTDENGNIVPKLVQNENIKVLFNGIALLDEIPYKPYGVFIDGYTEVPSGTSLNSTQFYVEYSGAGARKLHFAVSEIGKHLTVTYKGLGKNCIIAANIATEYTEDGDIVQSLADYIDTYIDVMDANRIHRQVKKYTATSSITTIPYASITGLTWNPAFDNLQIIRDNLILIEDENYTVDDVGITLYEALGTGESIFVIVFRGLLEDVPAPSSDGSLLLDGSVGLTKLETLTQDKINAIPTIQTEQNFLDQLKLKFIYGAIGDGNSHPLSGVYGTLEEAQVLYPCATALTDEIDWCAIQTLISESNKTYIPKGDYKCNKSITLGTSDFEGSGTETRFTFTGCHGFITSKGGRWIASVRNFRVLGVSCDNYAAFKSLADETVRTSCYEFKNIEIQGNFGAGFFMQDMFRLKIQNVGMTYCYNAVILKGQCVQVYLQDIVSNCELSGTTSTILGTDTNKYGLYVGGHNELDLAQRPESVKAVNCCFVGHDYGIYQNDCLYSVYQNCDLDYCRKYGVYYNGVDGGSTLENCWIALSDSDGDAVEHIGVYFRTPGYFYKVARVINNTFSLTNGTSTTSIAIKLGDINDATNGVYKQGVLLENNEILSGFKYGIFANKPKDLTIIKNYIPTSATTADIKIIESTRVRIVECHCGIIDISSNASWVEIKGTPVTSLTRTGTSKYICEFLPDSSSPTTGNWMQGDKIYNSAPTAGSYTGWICTVGGTPGTWKGFGLIQA